MTEEQKLPSIHQGHRQRMLETYLSGGLDGFSDVQVLEFLLGYGIPRQDVNELAHALLREFGSLHRVFEATDAQLMHVTGVGRRTAALLRLIPDLWARTEQSRLNGTLYLRSTAELGRYLAARAEGLLEERVWLLSLDAKCKVIECRELGRGSVNSVNLPLRRLLETALLSNATSVILAHNHTSGTLLPSLEDIEYTRAAARTLSAVDVILADHFIVGNHSYVSMRASHMLPEL